MTLQKQFLIPNLSSHDRNILHKLQDPEFTPSPHELKIDESLPPDPHISVDIYPRIISSERTILRRIQNIELQLATTPSETSSPLQLYLGVISSFNELVEAYPSYASIRNNRAQAIRRIYGDGILVLHKAVKPPSPVESPMAQKASLSPESRTLIHRVHRKLFSPSNDSQGTDIPTTPATPPELSTRKASVEYIKASPKASRSSSTFMPPLDANVSRELLIESSSMMLDDLDMAISLLSPQNSGAAISSQAAKTLAQAYTQRGAVYYLTAKQLSITAASMAGTDSTERITCVPELVIGSERREKDWGITEFENAAAGDFWMGGKLGNQVANGLAVATNPMARLCGGIVDKALRREMEGKASEEKKRAETIDEEQE